MSDINDCHRDPLATDRHPSPRNEPSFTAPAAHKRPIAVTVSDFCKMVGIGRTLAFQLLKTGEVQGVRIGRRRLVTMESIEDLIEQSKT